MPQEDNNAAIQWQDRKHHLWFPIGLTSYYIKNDRLMTKKGLLTTTLDETLLYRIVDITCRQTIWGRLFGTGNILIKTKVDANPDIVLENISRPFQIRDMLSEMVEDSREKRNVVGMEFYGGGHHPIDRDGDGICDVEQGHTL